MQNQKNYRHEFKYPVSAGQIALLRARVGGLLRPDPHAGPDGRYVITSLYFDDLYNTCYYENENGTDPREKFRIRIYNHSADRITLELKRKEQGKTLKTSCPLTRTQTESLVRGVPLGDIARQPPLLQKLTAQMLSRGLRPAVVVEYERYPYICREGNVRVTFDTNLSSSRAEHFLQPQRPRRPVMPRGQHLLEVKYDAFLPDSVYRALMLENLQAAAYSKYYLCRRFALQQPDRSIIKEIREEETV